MRPAGRGQACREIPEPILDGVTGILVPPDDPHRLAEQTVKPASSHPAEDQTYPGRHV